MFKVLTYVNGILTVINGDDYFSEKMEKPEFITGETFYYEPTLKQMDGLELNQTLIEKAVLYIDSFGFGKKLYSEEPVTEEVITEYYVDLLGNYVGNEFKEGYIKIDVEPEDKKMIWDFVNNVFYNAIIVEKTTGHRIFESSFSLEYSDKYVYVKESNYNLEICNECQVYNFNTNLFEVDMLKIKNKRLAQLGNECLAEIRLTDKDFGFMVNSVYNSWLRQELEAKAWVIDNNVETPFIDNILIGRNLGETKAELISKIITKANNYKTIYGQAIGKLEKLSKDIESCTTFDEIKAIVW